MNRWLIISVALAVLFAIAFTGTRALIRSNRGALSKGTEIAVPSGQVLWFLDHSADTSGGAGQTGGEVTRRFRFVAPAIAKSATTPDYDSIRGDMDHLCEAMRLVLVSEGSEMPAQIVIALAEQETSAGATDPDVTKLFAAYALDDGHCNAEVF